MKQNFHRALLLLSFFTILLSFSSCNQQNEPQPPLTPVTMDVRADGASLQFNIDGEQQTVNTKDVEPHAMPAALRLIMAGKRE